MEIIAGLVPQWEENIRRKLFFHNKLTHIHPISNNLIHFTNIIIIYIFTFFQNKFSVGDHYPYYLSDDEVNEVSSYEKDGVVKINHSNFILWNSKTIISMPTYCYIISKEWFRFI